MQKDCDRGALVTDRLGVDFSNLQSGCIREEVKSNCRRQGEAASKKAEEEEDLKDSQLQSHGFR